MTQERWWIVAGVLAGAVAAGFLARVFLGFLAGRWTHRTPTAADDVTLGVLRSHVFLWCVLAGVVIAMRSVEAPEFWTRLVARVTTALFILSLCSAAARILTAAMPAAARRFAFALPATTLTKNLIQAVVFFFGFLMILSNFGISIGPMLTALGVGSLAVGLALQETLSNIFAGFYLLLFREVRVGDKIEMERGIGYGVHKGTVLDIGWRSSRLDMEDGHFTIVPNSFMTQSIITVFNRHRPPASPAAKALASPAPSPDPVAAP
jgi:small-conductance mechanosensitive channel